jgi:hypothetical protein
VRAGPDNYLRLHVALILRTFLGTWSGDYLLRAGKAGPAISAGRRRPTLSIVTRGLRDPKVFHFEVRKACSGHVY